MEIVWGPLVRPWINPHGAYVGAATWINGLSGKDALGVGPGGSCKYSKLSLWDFCR